MNCFKEIQKELMERLDQETDLSDEQIRELIDEILLESPSGKKIPLSGKVNLQKKLFDSVRGLDVLQELVDDTSVTEIMVNRYDQIFIERRGKLERLEKQFTSQEKLEDVIQQIVGKCNRIINESRPIVDARLDNGARVNAVVEPACIGGPILTIRRFPDVPIDMEQLIHLGSITKEAADFLKQLVECGYSIMIGGGTSTGKTTFLNALSGFIPKDERIITIEDTAELQIQGIDNLVRLEVRNANLEEGTDITIRDLIRTALRMRPDRVIVGEIRQEEAIDLLQAWNTGHDGSIGTAHANSTRDMVSRIESMCLMGMSIPIEAIRRQIASGIDIMIHLERLRNRTRKVMEISEVVGYENGEVMISPIFSWNDKEQCLKCVGALRNTKKLERMQYAQNSV